jgi:hypothetical protein
MLFLEVPKVPKMPKMPKVNEFCLFYHLRSAKSHRGGISQP